MAVFMGARPERDRGRGSKREWDEHNTMRRVTGSNVVKHEWIHVQLRVTTFVQHHYSVHVITQLF